MIGTGSSAIQSNSRSSRSRPDILLYSSARPNFSIPAHNAPLNDEARAAFRSNYPEIRRFAREETRNGIYTDLPDRGAFDDGDNARQARYRTALGQRWPHVHVSPITISFLIKAANDTAADFVRSKIRGDGQGCRKRPRRLQPDSSSALATKRICVDTDYYEPSTGPNVDAGRHQRWRYRGNPAQMPCVRVAASMTIDALRDRPPASMP